MSLGVDLIFLGVFGLVVLGKDPFKWLEVVKA